MANPIIFKITNAGKNAMLDAQNNGITLRLTHVALGTGKYAPTGNEIALAGELQRWVITNGGIEPATHTVRFSSSITSAQELTAYEIGAFTDTGVLFAVASNTDEPLVKIYPDITFIASFGLALDDFDVSKITVSQDNEGALSIALMQQHLASPDPHPQYLRKGGVAGSAEDIIERIVALENRKIEPVSIGGLLITTNNYANSKAVRAGEGYGVWTRYAEGRVPIGVGTAKDINAQSKTFTLGQMGGEYSHILTEAEMPSHTHEINQGTVNSYGEIGTYTSGDDKTNIADSKITSDTKGGSKPHNNIQPFVAVGIWLRLPDNYVAPTFNTYWTTDVTGMNKVTGFSETDNIYLWIEAGNITGSLPVIHSYATTIDRGGVDQVDDINSTIPAPSSIKNGKNLVFAATTDSYSISGDVTLNFGITISDIAGATEYTVTSSTSVANTVIDGPTTIYDFSLDSPIVQWDGGYESQTVFVNKDNLNNEFNGISGVLTKDSGGVYHAPTSPYIDILVAHPNPFPRNYQIKYEVSWENVGGGVMHVEPPVTLLGLDNPNNYLVRLKPRQNLNNSPAGFVKRNVVRIKAYNDSLTKEILISYFLV